MNAARALYWSTPIPHALWAEPEIKAMRAWVRPGACVIDVGASVGLYTLPFAKAVGPTGCVVAFEPCRASHDLLASVVRRRRLANVRLERLVVGETHTSVRLGTPVDARGLAVAPRSYVLRDAEAEAHACAADATSIDEYCGANRISDVCAIKLDIEGYELFAIRGARHVIANCRPTLLVEIEQRHTIRYRYQPADIWEELCGLKYVPYITDGRNRLRRLSSFDASHNNFLFVPGERDHFSAPPHDWLPE